MKKKLLIFCVLSVIASMLLWLVAENTVGKPYFIECRSSFLGQPKCEGIDFPEIYLDLNESEFSDRHLWGKCEEFRIANSTSPLRKALSSFFPNWWPGNHSVFIREYWRRTGDWWTVIWLRRVGDEWTVFHALTFQDGVAF